VKNLETGALALASSSGEGEEADRSSFEPSLSADARFVAIQSEATNLVAGLSGSAQRIFVKTLGP
jgi:hypothetical protein